MKDEEIRRVIAAVAMVHPCTFPKDFVKGRSHNINDPVAPEDIKATIVSAVAHVLADGDS